MKTLITFVLGALSFAAFSQQVEVKFEKICAFPQDGVEKEDFVLYGDSGQLESIKSKKISITPNTCKKTEFLASYNFSIPVFDIGDPLRLQLAEQSLLFYKLGYQKIFIGDPAQLERVKHIEDSTFLTIEHLKEKDELIELKTKYALVHIRLKIKN